jgi:hypothetical protein
MNLQGALMPDRKANVRTALILLSVALVFFFGIIAKRWLFPG